MIIDIKSTNRTELIDITDKVKKAIPSDMENGLVYIFSLHTTGAITINENADPDVKTDILKTINKIIPWDDNFKHMEGNSAAHIKTSLFGQSETIAVEKGKLVLGIWQDIYFCEFDGPRNRKVYIKLIY
ncbi:MAG: YjbQ family protein [Desulfobacteraceae bacterium]|nr:YjbQ family protein [Desulfobacteraceae bacterium]